MSSTPEKLNVLWTTGDKDTALNMVFMYTLNSLLKGWWDEVCLIIWGASPKLLCADAELQAELAKMKEAGVQLLACKACADRYGLSGQLEQMGVEVIYMGQPLTTLLKQNAKLLTF